MKRNKKSRTSAGWPRIAILAAAVLALAWGGGARAEEGGASFEGLGFLPDGFRSDAFAISADGSVVVGASRFGPGASEAFRWEDGSMVGLGYLRDDTTSLARGVSADGSVVVGTSGIDVGATPKAFRWEDGSMVDLGLLPGRRSSRASGVSADGSVVVGWSFGDLNTVTEAFRWEDGSMVGLGLMPGDVATQALGVSADGSVVVGRGVRGVEQAFRWENGDMVGLGFLPDHTHSRANAASADGSVVVGRSGISFPPVGDAFRWEDGSMVGLGDQPNGTFWEANAVSGDGSVIVGQGVLDAGPEAVIWDAARGMRSLKDVLVDDFGLDLTGWTLWKATGISADGNAIAGWGFNPDGATEAWIARLVAQLFRWTNTDGGLFSEGDNWETPNPPGVDDRAIIDEAGAYTITFDDSVINAGLDVKGAGVDATLDLAGHDYSAGPLDISDGAALTFTGGAADATERVVVDDGQLTIDGDAAELELKGDLTVGDAGNANLSVLNGGTFATKELEDDDEQVIAEGKTKVGVQFGSTGRIIVDGEDSAFTSRGALTLGDEGNGIIEVSDGGAFTARDGAKFGVELGSTGDASVVDEDSTLTVRGSLTLGDAGAGRLLVGDGATASADAVTMGKQLNAIGELVVSGPMSVFEVDGALIAGAAGHADVLVEAGGRLDAASLAIGTEAFVQDRLVTVEGGDSLLHTGQTLVGDQGNGSLVIRDGGRVESGTDPSAPAGATLGRGAFGDGDALISGGGSEWEVGGELTVGDGGFGVIDVELGGQLTTAGGRLGATGNGGPGHVTVLNPDSKWTSTERIVLAGTEPGATDPGAGTGQAILHILDHAGVEAPAVTLGAGLAPGHLNIQSGGKLVADDGIDLRWGHMDVSGADSEVRSSAGALEVGNASATFTDGAFGSFDTVTVRAPLSGGGFSELLIASSTVEATNTLDPAVVVGGESGGAIVMTDGLLDAEGGEVHVGDNGTLAGTGTVRGNLNVTGNGFVAPGLSPGHLSIDGDFAMTSGLLEIEIGGHIPGEQFDVLEVTGDVELGGILELVFIDRFAPLEGDVFDFLLVGGELTGDFERVNVSGLRSGSFATGFDATAGAFRVTSLTDASAIPTPTAALMGLALLTGLAVRRPRRGRR